MTAASAVVVHSVARATIGATSDLAGAPAPARLAVAMAVHAMAMAITTVRATALRAICALVAWAAEASSVETIAVAKRFNVGDCMPLMCFNQAKKRRTCWRSSDAVMAPTALPFL